MTAQPPPEALGPGQERDDGSVAYGVPGRTAVVPPARPAWERDRDRATYTSGCARCSEIPADLVAAIVAALRAAKAGGRP
jgi:hypothetical protein